MNHRHVPLLLFPLLKLVLHLVTYRGYGMFRDEFYYLACADRLAWGYVDHPPLSIFVLWMARSVLGSVDVRAARARWRRAWLKS